jgi:hypothetical protein
MAKWISGFGAKSKRRATGNDQPQFERRRKRSCDISRIYDSAKPGRDCEPAAPTDSLKREEKAK